MSVEVSSEVRAVEGATASATPLLEVTNLVTTIRAGRRSVRVVDGVSLDLAPGQILGLVGESGSGKSLLLLSILGLLNPPVSVESGSVRLKGRELVGLSERELRRVRGAEMSMVFQEPLTSLDPAYRVGRQLTETIRAHRSCSRAEASALATDMLRRVGIGSPAARMQAFPHELSGGMRQRVMIAMALLLGPSALLADEPVTALDVTTQAQILELILSLQHEMGMAVLLVSHDLGVMLDVADRVAVMYAGQIVEVAAAAELATSPRHPYTRGLLTSKLSLLNKGARVEVMPGRVPSPSEIGDGCRFAPRCPRATERCSIDMPPLEEADGNRRLRCFNPLDGTSG
jgi:oligopeptide/dipeptide ABC transporter ATP-binding protein